MWLCGEQIDWELHMVVLSEERVGDAFPPDRVASTRRDIQLRYGMPIDWPTASRVDLPGFRPVEAYEAALANIGPELVRRPDPESVEEVLAWAGMPVVTAEVAAVCDRDIADVRTELARLATFLPVGGDGYSTAATN